MNRREMLTIAAAVLAGAGVGVGLGRDVHPALAAVLWHTPFMNRRPITSGFGPRPSPGNGGSTNHKGIDLPAATGDAVYAVSGGTVTMAQPYAGFGNHVRVDHGDGWMTTYSHFSTVAVARGQRIELGTRLGAAGSTGNSTGPHLHLELHSNGVPVDPGPVFGNAPLNPGTPTNPLPEDDLPYTEAQLKLIIREAMIGILRAEEFNRDTVSNLTATKVWEFRRDDMPGRSWEVARDARNIARRAEDQCIAANAKLDKIISALGA